MSSARNVAFQRYEFSSEIYSRRLGFYVPKVFFHAYVSGRDRINTVVKRHGSEYTHHNHPDTHWHERGLEHRLIRLEAGTCGAQTIVRDSLRHPRCRSARQGTVAVCSDPWLCVLDQVICGA